MDIDTYEREGRNLYEALARAVARIIETVAGSTSDYRIQQVQHRAKGVGSLRTKLEARSALASTTIEAAVKDLAGVRVILYTNADVVRFISSGVIVDNFDVDWDRTKFHYPMAEPTAEDGFISYNYVVRLKAERLSLPEYCQYAGMSCEVQVQTTLDHAWSEMAHDTIYKPPPPGFGGEAMKSVAERMTQIMQKHLRPAGFEFQKVVADVRAFERGRAIAEQDPLRRIAEASDNNERYDRLSEFREHALRYYDDLPSHAAEFRRAMVSAVLAARSTPTVPQNIHGMSFEGVTTQRVVGEALDIIDRIRFMSADSIDETFEALCDLWPGAAEEEQRRLLQSAERLAKHDMDVWKAAGPLVQQRLTALIGSYDAEKLSSLRQLVVEALKFVLQSDVTGTSSTYDAVTFHMGAVLATEDYLAVRRGAIAILEGMFFVANDVVGLRDLIHAFNAAGRLPDHGDLSAELLGAILSDSLRIVRFVTSRTSTLPMEIRQEYEHDLVWRYRHNSALPPAHSDNAALEKARAELQGAILAYRDAVNADEDFVIYKTLVGFQSVFPPAWDGDDFQVETAYRAKAINQYVAQVDDHNFDRWLTIIRRCAATDTRDGAAWPSFHDFLKQLGRAKPHLGMRLLGHLDKHLERFVSALLQGLEGTQLEAEAEKLILEWVEAGEHLVPLLGYLDVSKDFKVEGLVRVADAAVAASDDRAVGLAMGVSAERYANAPDLSMKVFLQGLDYFATRHSASWINNVWFQAHRSGLLNHLSPSARAGVLSNLVEAPKLDFHTEELLRTLVDGSPTELLPFFRARLLRDHGEEIEERYEAIPFEFHRLDEVFALIPVETVAAVREWYQEEADHSLFEYWGGALIQRAFPDFDAVAQPLQALVRRNDEGDVDFVLRVLMAYKGDGVILPICREVVALLPPESSLLDQVDFVLEQSGMVSGEFGFVELHRRRKAELEPWLGDENSNVRAYAERRGRQLDLRIAAEQRRSREGLELRKRQYGE